MDKQLKYIWNICTVLHMQTSDLKIWCNTFSCTFIHSGELLQQSLFLLFTNLPEKPLSNEPRVCVCVYVCFYFFLSQISTLASPSLFDSFFIVPLCVCNNGLFLTGWIL